MPRITILFGGIDAHSCVYEVDIIAWTRALNLAVSDTKNSGRISSPFVARIPIADLDVESIAIDHDLLQLHLGPHFDPWTPQVQGFARVWLLDWEFEFLF